MRLVSRAGRQIYGSSLWQPDPAARTEPAKGSPKNPMTYEEVADKFRTNAEFARWPAATTESNIMLVRSLERAPNMTALTSALSK